MACDNILKHPTFKDEEEINVIGFSQGGLIARYITQVCPIKGKVRNLVTVGTPNMGLADTPVCGSMGNSTEITLACGLASLTAKMVGYSDILKSISPTGFYRDVDNLRKYYQKSTFLANLNNEVAHESNVAYRDRMLQLNTATFIQWDNDIILHPRETAHFGQLES